MNLRTVNWQSWILVAMLLGVIAYGIHDWRSDRGPDPLFEEPIEDGTAAAETTPADPETMPMDDEEPPPAAEPAPVAPTAAPAPAAMSSDQVRERFGQALRTMGPCLGLTTVPGGDRVEPTLDNFIQSVRGEVGESVLQTEDWSMAELTTSSGEKRILRVEMDYSGEDRIVRRVKYSRVNADGSSEPIPLAPEQAEDPTETFIASLESDGQVQTREKAQRIYFGGGEEIVVTEKNGLIDEISMSRSGRLFRCRPSDPNPDSCACGDYPPLAPDGDQGP